MSTTEIYNFELNSSEEWVPSICNEENENKRTENPGPIEGPIDKKDPKDLFAFYCLGVCNTFFMTLLVTFETAPNLSYPAVMIVFTFPIIVVKISPLFISTLMK